MSEAGTGATGRTTLSAGSAAEIDTDDSNSIPIIASSPVGEWCMRMVKSRHRNLWSLYDRQ